MSNKKALKLKLIYSEKVGDSELKYYLVENGLVVKMKSDPVYLGFEVLSPHGEESLPEDTIFELNEDFKLFN